jgi:methionine sulfoxide reductase heme-binding subunit
MKREYNLPFIKLVVFLLCLSPLYEMLWYLLTGHFGDYPSWEIIGITGEASLFFLLLTLLVTPLRRLFGWNILLSLRRLFGLFAYSYATLHFFVYIWREENFILHEFFLDIVNLPYITVGILSWLLMVPLAMTANDRNMKRLGKNWRKLHTLVYPLTVFACLHYILVQIWAPFDALEYTLLFVVLLGYRFVYARTPEDWSLRVM